MALTIQAKSISADGESLIIEDTTVWASEADPRNEHAVLINGIYRLSTETSEAVGISSYDPVTVEEWTAATPTDGRLTFNAYAYYIKGGSHSPADQDVQYDTSLAELQQYTAAGTSWAKVELVDVLDKAVLTSATLEVPSLTHAYILRSLRNLEYVVEVKQELAKGAKQNRLFYKRTDMDYIVSLIMAAEYNWALEAYTQFYDIVYNLNNIILTDQIS